MNRAPACPGCDPFGAPGWLPVVLKAGARGNPYDRELTTWRPCQTCRPDQYRKWRWGRSHEQDKEAS